MKARKGIRFFNWQEATRWAFADISLQPMGTATGLSPCLLVCLLFIDCHLYI